MSANSSLCLEWKNLNLNVKKKNFEFLKCKKRIVEKKLLRNVSGFVESGQLIAILGPSGAGKTSLLAAISRRYRGKTSGDLLLNNEPVNRKTMTRISCFVPQFDITLDSLTPYEHLYFMAELRIDRNWTKLRKRERIESLLWTLGLQRVAHNRISTLSGGERKKLNLASDLLTNPSIIFCDEPTTGLDSYNASLVMNALKKLAISESISANGNQNGNQNNEFELIASTTKKTHGKAIVCSIHQPTSRIFQLFTHIILMQLGQCIFQGTQTEAIDYFASLGYRCPESFNPADYYLNVMSKRSIHGEKSFFDNPSDRLDQPFEYKTHNHDAMTTFEWGRSETHKKICWSKQVWTLLYRNTLASKRNLLPFLGNLFLFLIPFFVMCVAYKETSGHTQQSVQDIQGAIFLIAAEVIFTASYSVLNDYASKIPILRRETHENIYSFSAYYFAEIISSVPSAFIHSFVPLAIIYFLSGFNRGWTMFISYGLILVASTMAANAWGYFLSGLFESEYMSAQIAPPLDLVFLVLAGVYINLHNFPILRYISIFYYANAAMSTLFWHDVTEIECPSEFNGLCLRNGTEVLERMSYDTTTHGVLHDFIGLFCLGLVMHSIAFIGIRRLIRKAGYY